MNRKLVFYSLVGILTGSVVTASAIPLTSKAFLPNSTSVFPKGNISLAQNQTTPNQTNPPYRQGMMGANAQHFIAMMIPHHEGAVAMADLALSRAQHPELKKLAEAIKTTQTKEIQQMQNWYKQWYGTDVPNWGPGMGWGWSNWNQQQQSNNTQPYWGPGDWDDWDDWNSGMGCCMMGGGGRGTNMMGGRWRNTNLYALQNTSDFDREFIQQMIPHHQMGVMMAQMVLTGNPRSEIKNLAESIIKSQTNEINQMQQWYQKWYQQS
jgi:uncharacterized protein (DUF305 family)